MVRFAGFIGYFTINIEIRVALNVDFRGVTDRHTPRTTDDILEFEKCNIEDIHDRDSSREASYHLENLQTFGVDSIRGPCCWQGGLEGGWEGVILYWVCGSACGERKLIV